jgi:hypothetical protein
LDPLILIVDRQHQDLDIRKAFVNQVGGLWAWKARQLHIQEDQVRVQFGGQNDRFLAVLSLTDHLDLGVLLKQEFQALPKQSLIVD